MRDVLAPLHRSTEMPSAAVRDGGPVLFEVLTLLAVLAAGAAPLGAQARDIPTIPIEGFTLSNGLEVIVSEDHSSPVVAIHMWYEAGSAHDPPGLSGLARLTQLLIRTETRTLQPGVQRQLVEAVGGATGSFTTPDVTGFWEVVPARNANLALWLEANRMRGLNITQGSVDEAVDRIDAERRERDEQPYAEVQRSLDSLATDYPPYRRRVLGSSEELRTATVADVRAFYGRHFVPANAVLSVAGHITGTQVRELVAEYFDVVPAGSVPSILEPAPTAPRTDGERRAEVIDARAQVPMVYIAYTIPFAGSRDLYALTLLSRILSTGKSSRLHRRIVEIERAAPVVFSGLNTRRASGLFVFGTLPNPGVPLERLETLIGDEVERLIEEGPLQSELDRAVNQVWAAEVQDRMSVQGKAESLQRFRKRHGSAEAINSEIGRYEDVTVDDLTRVARTYLDPANRTVLTATPERSSTPSPQGSTSVPHDLGEVW